MKNKGLVSIIIFIAVLIIDQIIKVEVKTGMFLGESIHITDWFQILFIENNGMAFGWELGHKMFLTIFRIFAVGFLGWIITKQVKKNVPIGFLICLSLILAGATGNIIDCLFYGMIFNESTPFHIAEFVSAGEGYSHFMTGKVVDMFYFPLIEWTMPDVPFLPYAGERCVFFSPIFNFADASISVAVVLLLVFYRRELSTITLRKNYVDDDKTKES
jgi:signal peptidase II